MFKRLLFLNGLATIGLILFHSAGWGFVAMYHWRERYLPLVGAGADQPGGVAYYVLRTMEQLPVAAIPAFLFVSGLFVGDGGRQGCTCRRRPHLSAFRQAYPRGHRHGDQPSLNRA